MNNKSRKKEKLNVLLINSAFRTVVCIVNENNVIWSTIKHHLITTSSLFINFVKSAAFDLIISLQFAVLG